MAFCPAPMVAAQDRNTCANPSHRNFRNFLTKPFVFDKRPTIRGVNQQERRPAMIRILALAAVAALLVVPSSYAFAARGGASGLAPGHEMRGLHGHSFNAPGQEFRRAGKVGTPGHPGASRFA